MRGIDASPRLMGIAVATGTNPHGRASGAAVRSGMRWTVGLGRVGLPGEYEDELLDAVLGLLGLRLPCEVALEAALL
jgi:hypothetical protein